MPGRPGGDGSVKDLGSSINNVASTGITTAKGTNQTFLVFNWAGDPIGPTGGFPAPSNW